MAPLIYIHPTPEQTIIPLLRAHFPYSVSLLRRIQHALAYPSSTARVLATFPPNATGAVTDPRSLWLAAYVDLFRGRETQIILYSSLQRDAPIDSNPVLAGNEKQHSETEIATGNANAKGDAVSTLSITDPAVLDLVRGQFLGLLVYIKDNLLPEYLATQCHPGGPSTDANGANTTKKDHTIPPPPAQAFLIGCLHTGLQCLLTASATYTDPNPWAGVKIHRFDNPSYVKYLFPPAILETSTVEKGYMLPPGYRFEDKYGRRGLQSYQFDLVQSRTHIPRSSKSLGCMPSLGIYFSGTATATATQQEDDQDQDKEWPIAWAFIGFDGALATLHVEPEHRGKGLAVHLSKEVMKRGLSAEGPFRTPVSSSGGREDGGWGHVEVAMDNVASRRVMEKVGGETGWTVTWTVVELVDLD